MWPFGNTHEYELMEFYKCDALQSIASISLIDAVPQLVEAPSVWVPRSFDRTSDGCLVFWGDTMIQTHLVHILTWDLYLFCSLLYPQHCCMCQNSVWCTAGAKRILVE